MKKNEFYTFEDLKKFLNFDDKTMKLSGYCNNEHVSMVIPLGTSIGQSVPPFFMDTEESMPGSIIYRNTKIFDDVKEIVDHWLEKRSKAKALPKVSIDNPQRQMEYLVKYMIAFAHLSEKRKSFPMDTTKTYEIEELWMREGYISIMRVRHIKEGFSDEEKQSMKKIDKSFFAYINDRMGII